jgi:hypothetical protein
MSILQTPHILNPETNTVTAVSPAELSTFNYAILVPNSMRAVSIGFVNNSYNDNLMTQDLNGVDYLDTYDVTHLSADAQLYRPIYKSTTLYLNATAFSDTGMVTSEQFNPNVLFAGPFVTMSMEKPDLFINLVKYKFNHGHIKQAILCDEMALDKWHRFPLYIRQEILSACGLKAGQMVDLDPETKAQIFGFGRASQQSGTDLVIVPSPSQILQQSQRSYGGKAKEGVFTVNRLNTISPAWLTAGNTNTTNHSLYECWFFTESSLGPAVIQPFYENAPAGAAAAALKPLLDTLWSKDMTWTWVRFDGLSLNSQSGTQMQLLVKKYYSGFEVQPSLTSPWSGLVKVGPKPDLESMQALMDAFYELKDAMPARYNFWGALAGLASKGLKTFGSKVIENLGKDSADAVTKKKPKPQKSDKEKKEVHDIDSKVDSLEKKLDMLLKSMNKRPQQQSNARPQQSNSRPQPSKYSPARPKTHSKKRGKQPHNFANSF